MLNRASSSELHCPVMLHGKLFNKLCLGGFTRLTVQVHYNKRDGWEVAGERIWGKNPYSPGNLGDIGCFVILYVYFIYRLFLL